MPESKEETRKLCGRFDFHSYSVLNDLDIGCPNPQNKERNMKRQKKNQLTISQKSLAESDSITSLTVYGFFFIYLQILIENFSQFNDFSLLLLYLPNKIFNY